MFLKNFDPVVSDEVFSVGTAHDVITPPIGFKIFSPEKSPKVSLSINDDLLVRVISMKNKRFHSIKKIICVRVFVCSNNYI